MSKKYLLQIRLDETHKRLLEKICREEKLTSSEKVRELIERYALRQALVAPHCETRRTARMPVWNKKTEKYEFRVGEMYSGPGGIGAALSATSLVTESHRFKFKHVWATDYDPDTCRTYKNNLLVNDPEALSICADIRDVVIQDLPKVDGLLYGFPCNDFSLVGESKGLDGKYGGLYKYGVNYVNHANPLFIFAENVSGLSSANSGKAFAKILKDLNHAGKHGYALTVHLYKFEEYGVPQARHRYIIIGLRGDLNLRFHVPSPTMKYKNCREAIEVPPIAQGAPNNELTRQSKIVIERLKHTKPGENAWTANLPQHLQLKVKGAKISQIYKRLDPTKPSYTVTGSGGGGTHIYHWSEPRALTNRERARLQTFPDNFVFYGSKESVRSQIGMAVPVEGAQHILTALLKTFAGMEYSRIEPSNGFYKAKSLR
jgi:DNA (cytosine-5)-methyltransferase 1